MTAKTSEKNAAQDRKATSRGLIKASRYLPEAGRPQSELAVLRYAEKLDGSESVLRAIYWAAMRDFDLNLAAGTVKKLEKRAKGKKSSLAWIERIKDGPLQAVDLTRKLFKRCPLQIEPVPDRVIYMLHNTLPFTSGGYATRGQGMAKGLRKAGLDLLGVSRPGYPFDLFEYNTPDFEVPPQSDVDGITYHRLPRPFRNEFSASDYMIHAAEVVEQAIRDLRPSCVIAASSHVTAVPACLAARKLGLPFVYEVRGFWEITRLSREPKFERTTGYKMQLFFESEVAKAADAVLTLTTPMKEELIARGVPEDRITLVPNSCDPSRFTPRGRDAALAAQYNIPDAVPVIGYIGSFVQYEGLEHLAQACALLRARGLEFRLLLVGNENATGNDRGPITEEILRVAREEGLQDWLIMPGRIPHEEVEAHYSLIDIAPFPRKPQPVTEMVSPMKPLEALAMEKAVMVSSVRALTEMIEDGKTGLVFEKGNVADMADVLARLIADAALRERLGRAGRAWVERERTWERTAGIARDVIRQVTAA